MYWKNIINNERHFIGILPTSHVLLMFNIISPQTEEENGGVQNLSFDYKGSHFVS